MAMHGFVGSVTGRCSLYHALNICVPWLNTPFKQHCSGGIPLQNPQLCPVAYTHTRVLPIVLLCMALAAFLDISRELSHSVFPILARLYYMPFYFL